MDCCGMPMAVRSGGGLMCRRCGNACDVPVTLPVNPCAVAVTEAAEVPPVAVVVVVNPSPVSVAEVYREVLSWPAEAVDPERVAYDVAKMEAAGAEFPVERPKPSRFGRGGRKGGPK